MVTALIVIFGALFVAAGLLVLLSQAGRRSTRRTVDSGSGGDALMMGALDGDRAHDRSHHHDSHDSGSGSGDSGGGDSGGSGGGDG
ncbi:hypothetical protein [uncultured Deinococcus sp.]|uniref:hypothetical protein n=1 Tax=uncultured Deinococcus sp. TaxID=158789 RepID=UPI0025D0BFB8|nr:hypothetical protein [uncultured Deinococcus sp.]